MRPMLLAGIAVALGLCVLLSLSLGSVTIPTREVLAILAGDTAAKASWQVIVLDYRLPKALTALLAGSALGVSGLMLQTLFRNPLAEPYILGISAGAGLGVALAVLAGGGALVFTGGTGPLANLGTVGAAVAGSALMMGLVLVAARRVRDAMTLLILGLMLGYASGALVSVLIHFSAPQQVQAYMRWTFGSFAGVDWSQLWVLTPVVVAGLVLALALAKPLNALLLGEVYARSMGLNVTRARLGIIAAAALLAGAVTAYCGPIAFLGIAIPHLGRSLFHSADHRLLVPVCIGLGGLLALLADLLAGLPGQQEVLPLNAITALVGAPLVGWIVISRWRSG